MLVMFLLSGPVPALVAFPLARFFASRAAKAGPEGAAEPLVRGER
jgi:hypothetical protein